MSNESKKSAPTLEPDRHRTMARAAAVLHGPLPFEVAPAVLGEGFLRRSRMGMLDAILEQPETGAMVRSIPSQDLHHLIHHIGIADAGALVPFTSDDQLRNLMDLDLWDGRSLVPERLERWLWALEEFGGREMLWHRVGRLDNELVLAVLLDWTRLHVQEDPNEELQPPDGMTYFFTPDRRMLVEVLAPDDPAEGTAEDRLPMIFKLIESLYADDVYDAAKLLDRARVEMPNEIEEHCRKFRDARLEDLGFVPRDEAQRIYERVDPRAAAGDVVAALRNEPAGEGDGDEAPVGTSLTPIGGARGFLFDVLAAIEAPEARRRFARAFGFLCNKAAVVRVSDLSDVERVAGSGRLVFHTLAVGVEFLSGGDHEVASALVQRVDLPSLHRVGHSLVAECVDGARAAVSPLGGTRATRLFDRPWGDVLAALLEPIPRVPELLDDPGAEGARFFESLADVKRARGMAAEARRAAGILHGRYGVGVRPTEDDDEIPAAGAEATLSTVWLTLCASGSAELAPIGAPAAEAWAAAARGRELDAAAEALELCGCSVEEADSLRRVVVESAAKRLADALGDVAERPVDRRVLGDLFLLAD